MATAPTKQGSANAFTPWLVPAVAALGLLLTGTLWVAGGLASALGGLGWGSAPLSPTLLLTLAERGIGGVWPGVSSTIVAVLTGALLVLTLGPVTVLLLVRATRSQSRKVDPLPSLGRREDLRNMILPTVAVSARRLRPSLGSGPLATPEVGVQLGQLMPRGPQLFSSWEDVIVAIMAPRAGKTTSLAVPAILNAPGAVVATSNKNDLWASTAAVRAADTGQRVWLFDPQSITHQPQVCWWNPLANLRTVEEADRLAGAFIVTVDDPKKKEIWGPAAQELLSGLLLAASSAGHTLVDVYGWLASERLETSVAQLERAGMTALAKSVNGISGLPNETKGGVFFTARTAVRCLRDPDITRWVTPPQDSEIQELDPSALARSRQTLYLLSKDGGGSAAPLVAALTDRVMRSATVVAERNGGRLDPPMVVVLDEAANVCRIGDLPELYSHLGSRGIIPLTILQSYTQGSRVWGEEGMRTLWSAATVKVVGSGIDDARFAEDLSRMVGDHDVTTWSRNRGESRGSTTEASRQQRILPASDIRTLQKGTALVLATAARPALVKLSPWYESPRAAEVSRASAEALSTLTTAAGATDA